MEKQKLDSRLGVSASKKFITLDERLTAVVNLNFFVAWGVFEKRLFFLFENLFIENVINLIIAVGKINDSELRIIDDATGQIVARYDGLCIKRQCNMYRVRPNKAKSVENVRRYPKILKVRMEEKFLSSEKHYFENKLTVDHLKKGVWICLEHFEGVTEKMFLEKNKLPQNVSFKKSSSDKCKVRVEVRVSALPSLKSAKGCLKREPLEEEEDDDLQVLDEILKPRGPPAQSSEDDLQVVYASPSVEANFKRNRKLFSNQNWSLVAGIDGLPVHPLASFDAKQNCYPAVMDRYLDCLAKRDYPYRHLEPTVKIVGLSSVLFEVAATDEQRSRDLEKYLQGLFYSEEIKFIFLPYLYRGRWSLLTYNLDEKRAENYVVSPSCDWRVTQQVEKILFSLQDKLMLRRYGLTEKNTYRNISATCDGQFSSGVKVMSAMRQIVLGQDPLPLFFDETDDSFKFEEYLMNELVFGNVIFPSELGLVRSALAVDYDMLPEHTDAAIYNFLARK